MLQLPLAEAETLALNFLVEDLNIPEDDRDFFSVLSTRETGTPTLAPPTPKTPDLESPDRDDRSPPLLS